MNVGWLILAVGAGVLIPVQAAINSKMGRCLNQPLYSSVVNFVVGTVVLVVLALILSSLSSSHHWQGLRTAPWWAWLGGLLGAVFVTSSVIIFPHVGAVGFTMAMLAGQLIGSLILDQKGWLEVTPRPFSWQRLLGVILAIVAVWLVTQSRSSVETPAT
jgi:transporter family-2 protein